MAIVDFNEVDRIKHQGFIGSLNYIESIDGGDYSDIYHTLFGPIKENHYIITVWTPQDGQIDIDMELSMATRLLRHMNLEDGPEETLGASVPKSADWYDSDHLPIRKLRGYKQEGSSCVFCQEHGKRTNDLYCEVPQREEYSNGWTHPVLGPGKSGNNGLHEDCLAFVTGFVNKFKERNKELFVSESL